MKHKVFISYSRHDPYSRKRSRYVNTLLSQAIGRVAVRYYPISHEAGAQHQAAEISRGHR